MSLEMFEGSYTQSHSQTIGPGALELCSPDTLYSGKKVLLTPMWPGPLHATTLQILRK